jgi:hypothetical protein
MLNTLRNHGYIKSSFTLPQLTKVFSDRLNIDANVTAVLFNGAISKGLNNTAKMDSLSLSSINAPGVSEHDASLVRKDFALTKTMAEFLKVDAGLVTKLLNTSSVGSLSKQELGQFRKMRILDSKLNNPKFVFNQDIAIRAAGESALISLVFGRNNTMQSTLIRKFFIEQRLPYGFQVAERITFPRFEAALREALFLFQ